LKISVITVCYNAEKTIAHTLRSVHEQTHKDIEHIIIDGRSTDDTLKIIEIEGAHVAKIVSEGDKGIYDAMNKGIALATGDVIGFINADDFYATTRVLETVASAFDKSEVSCCYGDLCYVSQLDPSRVVRYWRSNNFVPKSFEAGWCPPHPTFFVKRSVYQNLGGFDLDFKIAADFELMARYLESARISSFYIPDVLVKMRLGGTTNKSLFNIWNQNIEIIKSLKKLDLQFSVVRFFLPKLVSRAMQFVKRPSL
jgi:glycosyltransferase involved in cell wall biosynthesis